MIYELITFVSISIFYLISMISPLIVIIVAINAKLGRSLHVAVLASIAMIVTSSSLVFMWSFSKISHLLFDYVESYLLAPTPVNYAGLDLADMIFALALALVCLIILAVVMSVIAVGLGSLALGPVSLLISFWSCYLTRSVKTPFSLLHTALRVLTYLIPIGVTSACVYEANWGLTTLSLVMVCQAHLLSRSIGALWRAQRDYIETSLVHSTMFTYLLVCCTLFFALAIGGLEAYKGAYPVWIGMYVIGAALIMCHAWVFRGCHRLVSAVWGWVQTLRVTQSLYRSIATYVQASSPPPFPLRTDQ